MKNIKLFGVVVIALVLCTVLCSCSLLFLMDENYYEQTDNTEISENSTELPREGSNESEDFAHLINADEENTQTIPAESENTEQLNSEYITETTANDSVGEDHDNKETDISSVNIPEADATAESKFEIHFIDVGQADAALVICDGKTMLIDGGNKADSQIMYTYLKKHDIRYLDYVIGTHAHEDHIGGLPGALNFADCGTVYCPVREYESEAFEDFVNQVEKKGSFISVPTVGTSFELGSASVVILSCKFSDDVNNSSIVLKITYGDTSFLFTGDAEREVEQYILACGADVSSTVLKVGHHGSETSTSYTFLREVMPEYAVISVGKNNTYGHPDDNVLSKLTDAGAEIYRTDLSGDIVCRSDGENVTFEFPSNTDSADKEKQEAADVIQDEYTQNGNEPTYILNINSNKFHYPECKSVNNMKDENKKEFFGTRESAINDGYAPCGACKP